MTHEELLAKLAYTPHTDPNGDKMHKALRTIVQYHAPSEWDNCLVCSGKTNETVIAYPCATVKIIELALQ